MTVPLMRCPHCGIPIKQDSTRCLYCGRDPKSAVRDATPEQSFAANPSETPDNYPLWILSAGLSAAVIILLGTLLFLIPLKDYSLGADAASRSALTISLAGCVLGIILVPLFGIAGGRIGMRSGRSVWAGISGAAAGGFIYAILVLIFGVLNSFLAG